LFFTWEITNLSLYNYCVVAAHNINIFDLWSVAKASQAGLMEQYTLKNVYNCLDTNINSYLETSGGSNLYKNVVQFFNTSVN